MLEEILYFCSHLKICLYFQIKFLVNIFYFYNLYSNKKYSQEILSESISKFLSENKNIKFLQAYILEENIASKKLFENLGFIYDDKKEIYNDGLEYLVLKKDTIQ
ncbi:GNAT family N-acetyltransferase [Fusobacterium hwasookii]|uniref:GNAT family N-acetyltransferase n=1 Tax=Fusobacterium hwasookii TaxID=1583098 RepID=UPI003B8A776A